VRGIFDASQWAAPHFSNSSGVAWASSAPGFCLTWKKAMIISLPGVPREMEEMMRQEVVPFLRAANERSGRLSGSRVACYTFAASRGAFWPRKTSGSE